MEDSWQLTPLTMSCSSSSSSKHRNNCSALLPEYSSYLQLTPQRFGDSPKQLQQEEHYYEMQRKMMESDEPQKTMHHFFDEWSPKDNRESWLDLDDKSSNNNNNGSVSSATQLSMSIPNSSQHDFSSIFSSNKHNQNWFHLEILRGVRRKTFALYVGFMTQLLPKCITNKFLSVCWFDFLCDPPSWGFSEFWLMSKNVLKWEKYATVVVCMRWSGGVTYW